MTKLGPRWRWQTVAAPDNNNHGGDWLDTVLTRLTQILQATADGPATIHESAETFIVSKASGDSSRIRGGLLDIETIDETHEDGIQLWRSLLKSSFPLAAETLRAAHEAWGIWPAPRRDDVSLATLVDEIVADNERLHAAAITKRRSAYVLSDCFVELGELTIDGAPYRTVGVQHADPDRVRSLLDDLGLAGRENISDTLAVKRALGWPDELATEPSGDDGAVQDD